MSLGFNQGYQGQVGFGVESTFGTAVAPTLFQDVGQGSAELKTNKPNKELLTGIRGTKQPVKSSLSIGKTDVSGSISGALYPDDFFAGQLFAALLGKNNTVTPIGGDGPANGFLHDFLPIALLADQPTGLTIQEVVGGDADVKVKDFTSMFCNGLTLEIPEAGLVNISTDWIGQVEGTPGGGTRAAATYTPEQPFENFHAKLSIGDDAGSLVDIDFESLTLAHVVNAEMVNNNFNCTRLPVGRLFGVPDITMEFTIKSTDSNARYNLFFNDSQQYIRLRLVHLALAGTAPGSEYEVIINLPLCEFFGETEGLTGPEQLTQPIQAQARFSVSDDLTIQYQAKNSVSTTYSA